jgi:hypothetical protein
MAAQSDTIVEKKLNKKAVYQKARTAAVMSAILPGSGQIYNKKYWKAPIVYAGLAGFGYLLYTNQTQLNYFSENLKAEYDEDGETVNTSGYSGDQLLVLKQDARKYRDMGVIGCAIIYALNIVDANVDGHLRTFDVSDDLTLQIKPYSNFMLLPNSSYCFQNGISLKFNFK